MKNQGIRYVVKSRYNLPKGTPVVLADSQSDPYRILATGETFYTLVTDPSVRYGFTPFDISSDDPYGRKHTPPFFVDRVITVTYDRLPGDMELRVGYSVDDCGIVHFTVCADPKKVNHPFQIKADARDMVMRTVEENADMVSSVECYIFRAPFDDAEICTLPGDMYEYTYLHSLKEAVNY